MADEKIIGQALSDDELDNVAGGNDNDRTLANIWIKHYYGMSDGKRSKLIDDSGDMNSTVTNFCTKAGIEYQRDEVGLDKFKINGEWRDIIWMAQNKETTLAFFDKQLGIQ